MLLLCKQLGSTGSKHKNERLMMSVLGISRRHRMCDGPLGPCWEEVPDHRCQASGIRRGARRGPAVLTGTDTSVLLKAPTPQRSRAPCRGPWSTCSPSPVPSSAGGALRLASVARRSPWWSLRHWLCSPVVWSPGFGLLGPPTWVPPGHAWG